MIKNYRNQDKINFRLLYYIILLKETNPVGRCYSKKSKILFQGNLPIFPYSIFNWIIKKDRGITNVLKIKIPCIKNFSRGNVLWLNSLRIDNEKQSTWCFWTKKHSVFWFKHSKNSCGFQTGILLNIGSVKRARLSCLFFEWE